MKLPALWISIAFACGIAAAQRTNVEWKYWVIAASAGIIAGALAAFASRQRTAWILALSVWLSLGALAATLERAALAPNDAARIMQSGQIDSTQPLHWRGVLREDPLELPWGRRYEIELAGVEIQGRVIPVTGGLQATAYFPRHDKAIQIPPLRAGNFVEALLRARPPRNFLDPGAFDERSYLAHQGIDLVGTLRSPELIQQVAPDRGWLPLRYRLARWHGNLLARINRLYSDHPERAAILRAMLLGDRSFVDSDTALAFQQTGAYHVLVVAGLHVAALAFFVLWLWRRLRFPVWAQIGLTIATIASYVAIVQDRPPILRAALVATFFLCARPLFRRIELLNAIGLAALLILLMKPSSLLDSSFQLSFLAAGVIAGLALPWIDRTSSPRRAALSHLGDVTRDASHPPKMIQLRMELRAASRWLSARLPPRISSRASSFFSLPMRCGLRIWEIALLSMALQWGMLPLMAYYFHRVTLSGPVSNIPAVVLTGLIVPFGFVCLATSFLAGSVATAPAEMLGILVAWLTNSVRWFGRVPRLSYRIPNPPVWLLIAFFAALILLAMASVSAAQSQVQRRKKRLGPMPIGAFEWCSAALLTALSVLIAIHPFRAHLKQGFLEVTVLDIGQGDSLFAAFPDGRTMLIDGGGLAGTEHFGGYRTGLDVGEDVVSPYLWSRGIKKLDAVVLTHAHHDHIDGLHAVLENFRVGQLWIGRDETTSAFRELLTEANAEGVTLVREQAGNIFNWGGVEGRVLWPEDPSAVSDASNNDSLTLRLTDRNIRFLLPGDIERKVESQLVGENQELAADFLKVPHHGSKTSSIEKFVRAVQPRFAAISAGEGNPFGHPDRVVVDRYQSHGVQVFRTDEDGAITALTDGNSLSVSSFAGRVGTHNGTN